MSVNVGSKRTAAPPPRKPSPPRQNGSEELTFRQKLEEIKRLRSTGTGLGPTILNRTEVLKRPSNEEPIVPQQVQTVTGVKTFLKSFGAWVEVVSSSGKVYYYNKKTQENQWKKPEEWLAEEQRLNPPLPKCPTEEAKPPEPPVPLDQIQMPPEDPPALPPALPKVKLKLKAKRKVKNRLKKEESRLPLAYQNNNLQQEASDDERKDKARLTVNNAFMDSEDEAEEAKISKLDKQDEIGHIDVKLHEDGKKEITEVKSSENVTPAAESVKAGDFKKFTPNAVGMERASNLAKGSAAQLAFQNISKVPESTAIYGEGCTSLKSSETGQSTFFTEFNLPCCLRRCKFPKEQDVLHELKINKLKKRNYTAQISFTGLDPKLSYLAEEAELEQFYTELKNYNNHDRLLTSRMNGTLVYKVVDEVWDRYFHKFQIKIFSGVYLECRPSGYSHNDELIYSRTGKVCGFMTFPEDEIRCQAILQAWKKDHCLCIYANKIFTVKRDDERWEDDLHEVRRFLEKNGF